jgi:hypothetical protein
MKSRCADQTDFREPFFRELLSGELGKLEPNVIRPKEEIRLGGRVRTTMNNARAISLLQSVRCLHPGILPGAEPRRARTGRIGRGVGYEGGFDLPWTLVVSARCAAFPPIWPRRPRPYLAGAKMKLFYAPVDRN